jgi:flavorubredoxin
MVEPVEIKKDVYWVGAVDWNVREFHGYSTSRGTTYNAYLVMGAQTALVDTVKAEFFPEMLDQIESLINPADIDYLVVNHLEMDHSGGLPGRLAAHQGEIRRRVGPGWKNPAVFGGLHAALARQHVHLC